MNAVNLIPLERRRSDAPALPGVPFLGLVAVLLVALAGTVVYVGARERVSSRQGELTHIKAGTAEWSAAAEQYAPAVSGLKHDANGFAQLSALLAQRGDWSLLLSQLAGVMPADAQLTALTANSGTGTSAATAADSGPGITITGCAASQPVVANTMVALRRLSGVSSVSLSSAQRQDSSGGGQTSSACPFMVDFNLSLQFSPTVGRFSLPGASGTGTGASAETAQTTTTATPTASTSDSTGAVAQ